MECREGGSYYKTSSGGKYFTTKETNVFLCQDQETTQQKLLQLIKLGKQNGNAVATTNILVH